MLKIDAKQDLSVVKLFFFCLLITEINEINSHFFSFFKSKIVIKEIKIKLIQNSYNKLKIYKLWLKNRNDPKIQGA